MYKQITIKNIKTFSKEQNLNIAPLTLLYGENSSGKTTLLKTFDIIHNIFSEQEVKRGKNVSQKDTPFYRNENIQNISSKKIHYYTSRLNKKNINIEINMDIHYPTFVNDLSNYFDNVKKKTIYHQFSSDKSLPSVATYFTPDKKISVKKEEVLSIPIKMIISIKYYKKKKSSKIESIEIKKDNDERLVKLKRIDKNYKKITDIHEVGYISERFSKILARPDRYSGTYHRGRPIAEPDYFVDKELYSDYEIITGKKSWQNYYDSYKNTFKEDTNIQFRKEAFKFLSDRILSYKYFGPSLIEKDPLKVSIYHLVKKIIEKDNSSKNIELIKDEIDKCNQHLKSFEINFKNKPAKIKPADKKWLDRLSKNYVKDKNFLNQLNIQFAEDEVFYETKAGKKFKEMNFKKRCEIEFAMMLSEDYSNINFFVIDNLLKGKKPKTFLQFANHAISETKALYKVRATKKSSNVMFWQIRENGQHSHTTYGIFRYITKFIENGSNNVFYKGKDLFGNIEPAPLFNPSLNVFRKCISEIKKIVNNLIICHPNKTDVFWSVPNEGDYPEDFLEKIEKLAKEKKLSRSEIAAQDEKIRKEFVERQKRVIDAHRISANGANFDNIISNNPKLLKELNKILKDVLNLKLVIITPKFLKKILKDPSLYNAFRNAQRRGLMYPTGMGMYRRNKFIMLQDLKFKRKFYIHGEEVGKGPTNIIPFLAQILSDRPNLTYLVQELENNWHPKYQSKIIELIARIIKSRISRTFILETHSELFVLQVQKLVQKGILKSNEVSINFISRNKLGDSEVHHLPLNSQGGFEKKWPGGFFTERMEILTS